jgi:hypothetical protein
MLTALEACHRIALREGQKENNKIKKGDNKNEENEVV